MAIVFDRDKNEANVEKHGLSFADFEGFDGEPVVQVDQRAAYGEVRYRAFGRVEGEARCLAYTIRDGEVRAISYRRAHEKEMRRYGL